MTATHGFDLLREQAVPEINSTARFYRHGRTGAELISLVNSDENKVFGVTFSTPPADSTGVAHILEHSVLCGSRKYPIKEPFVELMKSSLNTFLNAMTFADKTCYPVASQNVQDFYNLVDVYLDAVFYPRLTPHIFQQEGWHYELEKPDAPLAYKGVVFNEMKGNYSSPDSMLRELSQQSLYPDITYGLDSGGDPKHIPDLTYEQLKAFHRQHYHPSNAKLFFYGDDDPEARLRLIDDYLREFERIEVNGSVPLQPRFGRPKRLARTYAAGSAEAGEAEAQAKEGMVTVNWMLDEVADIETGLGFDLLEYILIGTPAAPLYKALIDSGLGEALAGGGLDDHLRQPMFSIGLKGIDPADGDKVERLILDTIAGLAEKGIDPLTVEAALNTVEFHLRENNTGSFPRGIVFMLRALRSWMRGRDPLSPLAFEAPLAAVKARVAGGRYFEELLRRHLIDNPHRTTMLLRPDREQAEREAKEEEERLARARAAMTMTDLERVVGETRVLKELQERPDPPEALATIPTLKLTDLPRQNKPIPLQVSTLCDTRLFYHDLFTNGVVYLDLGFDLHTLPPDLLPYMSLFGRALLETGVGNEDFVRLSQRIGSTTGGISPQRWASATLDGKGAAGTSTAWFNLRAKALPGQTEELLAILRDILTGARLDNGERLQQLVLEEKASLESRLVPGGSTYVARRLGANFHEYAWADEQMGGISYLFFLRKLAEQVTSDCGPLVAALQRIRKLLVDRAAMLANVTAEATHWAQLEPQLAGFLGSLPRTTAKPSPWRTADGPPAEGLIVPSQVNFVGKGANLYAAGFKPSGTNQVINRYLRTSWLWDKVRVQGGAYGGMCMFDRYSGTFMYGSYRDPNLLKTLEVYDRTAEFLKGAALDDAELTRNIIGTIGDIDTYRLPDAKGFVSMQRHLIGDSDEARQRMREEILSTTAADIQRFADAAAHVAAHGRVVVLGSEEAIKAANAERPGFLQTSRVL
jgi:Zn-dependent M16 (insulinase) family peptidase